MSLLSYPKYKDSGLDAYGNVPEHWRMTRLRFVAALNPSKSEVANLDKETEVSFLPMDSIGDDGSINLEQVRPISQVETGYTFFRDGDVTLAKITPCFENGKGAIMRGLFGGIGFGTTELVVARPIAGQTISEYLHWIFVSTNFRKSGEGAMYGAGGQKRISDDFVRNFPVALPPLEEQLTISTFLDRETAKIEALISEQEKLITLLAEKRQATISHAVTKGLNPDAPMKDSRLEWLGEVPVNWTVCKLSLRYSVELGKMLDEKRISGDYLLPYLRNQDVQWGAINVDGLPMMDIRPDEIERYTVRSSDLLVCEGGDVGRAAVWTGGDSRIGFQKALHRLRPLDLTKDSTGFFYFSLIAAKAVGLFNDSGNKATIAHLPAEKFRQYRFAFPPFEEQECIVNFLNNEIQLLDSLAFEATRGIGLLKERRSALISAAVTGKIDVRQTGQQQDQITIQEAA